MTLKASILLLVLSIIFQLSAQEKQNKFDFRLGAGISLLGTGDMITTNFENELNYKLNQYFTNAISLNYGRSNSGVSANTSFIQGNLNIYFSPFKNSKRNDFRMGVGISYYNVSDTYQSSSYNQDGQIVYDSYAFDVRKSFGYNIIVENTYSITERIMLGLKLFSQPYSNGDINSGAMLKLGLKI